MKIRHASRFKLGFEIEMVYDAGEESFDSLSKKFRRLSPGITTSEDGSIADSEGYYQYPGDLEIKTPPLLVEPAFALLKRVFNLVEKYGYTNDTTGFHINISPVQNQIYYALNPFELIKSPLWNKIKKDFKREGNKYCQSLPAAFKFNNSLELFHKIGAHLNTGRTTGDSLIGKYNAISFRNYTTVRHESSRAEVRAMGGANYHQKYNLIVKHTDNILTEFMKSCNV